MCCGSPIVIVIGGSGDAISTIYSADGTLLATRTVTMNGNNLILNGTQDLTYTDAGRLTLALYASGLDDSISTNPANFIYTNSAGQLMSSPIYRAGQLLVASEASGTVNAALNYLTPINVSSTIATVIPPTGSLSTNSLFAVVDSRANAGANNILINFSGVGALLYGSSGNTYTLNNNASFASFRYLGGTIGWIVEK